MAKKNQVLDMSPLGMIFTVLATAEDTKGKSLDLQWKLLPGCNMKDPLVHIHPNAVETYDILEGNMEFFIRDRWYKASKGDKLCVPAGVTHAFRVPGSREVIVFNTHQPAFRMENYFEDVCKVLDKITSGRQKEFKMNFKTMLYMSVLMNHYRNEIIAVKPPDTAIRLLGKVSGLLKVHY